MVARLQSAVGCCVVLDSELQLLAVAGSREQDNHVDLRDGPEGVGRRGSKGDEVAAGNVGDQEEADGVEGRQADLQGARQR